MEFFVATGLHHVGDIKIRWKMTKNKPDNATIYRGRIGLASVEFVLHQSADCRGK